jgi:hypothetical protein
MPFNPNGCSHGVRWEDECPQCNAITIKQEIYDLSSDCKNVANQLSNQPFMATSPEVIIDLYRTVDRLALILLKMK